MKPTKMAVLATTLGLLALAPAAGADTLLEKIAMAVLADKFGLNTQDIVTLHQQTGGTIYDLAPIYETSYYTKSPPSRVYALRNQGLGWGQVAHKLGMHPGTFNKLRNQGAFDRDRFWATNYHDRFGVPTQQVTVIQKSGGSLEDILGAIIVGKLTKQSPQVVYDQFRTDRSWTTITTRYNAPLTNWRRVTVPVRTVYWVPKTKTNVHHDNGVRDHGAGIGKGKSKGKSGMSHGGPVKVKGNSGHGTMKAKGTGNASHGNSGKAKGGPGKSGGMGKGNAGGKGKGKGGGGKGHGKGG